jgi:hypothetical protein
VKKVNMNSIIVVAIGVINFKGIVSRDFGVFFISLDRHEVPNRARSGLFSISSYC